ncbi:hypothetical protein BH23CHL8_BH23CHL8_04420 [soil metagenome]
MSFRRTVMLAAVSAAIILPLPGLAVGASAQDRCTPSVDTTRSVARHWDEVLLDAIRRDFPQPTVHGRNLFHVSAAMWDAWAAFDPVADGVFVQEKLTARNPDRARERAISYAAYRILSQRYRNSPGAEASLAEFDDLMGSLCFPTARTKTRGNDPTALGNRIARTILRAGQDDGSNEEQGYAPPDHATVNEPLIVIQPGAQMVDPNRWQPLALEVSISQNGQVLPVGPQKNLSPHWGHVSTFALELDAEGVPIDPGPPPLLHDPVTDAAFKESALEVIRLSSWLDASDGVTIDISPGARGNNTLGTNDGTGQPVNPATGQPYEPNLVARGDFARALAAYWADGPRSETPPGHWNTLANAVTDAPEFSRRIAGQGPELDALEWDVKMYLALNGAVHDAAVAAWGTKGHYDSARPISMIRYMGGLGQSSDPTGPSYHPDGLSLEDGLVEVITDETTELGERHAHLAGHIGEIAILAWQGNPKDPEAETSGVGWIRAVEWVPFQLATFVTPAFAGYVSGHSTFSRAAAEVLTAMTGSEYVPAGLGSTTVLADSLEVEKGPSTDVELQWATYYDAADQAGLSRLLGGIHIPADDFGGRIMGSQCGTEAWLRAQRYFDGSAHA